MKQLKIPSIFTAVDKLTAPIKKMGDSLEGFKSKAARAERSLRKISSASKEVAMKSALVGAAIAAPLVLAGKEAINFEKKMSNVSTLIDTSTEDMSAMSKQVLDLSKRVPASLDDLTTSLFDIRSAGIPAAQSMDVLESSTKLATAGLGTATEATDIMTSSINSFKSENLSAAQIQDILFKTTKYGKTTISALSQAFGANASIVQSAGIKLADFQAATAALTTTGLPAAQAQNQIRSSIVKLLNPTAEMEKVFKKLGVTSGEELIKKYGSLGKSYEAIIKTSDKLNLKIAKVLGSSEALAAVTSISGATNEAYVTTLQDMVSGSNAVNEAFNKQMNTGAAQAQLAENNMKALSITIGTTLIPIFNSAIQKITPLIDKFMKWAQNNPKTLATIVGLTAAVAALSLVVSGISTVISIVTGLTAAWGIITKSFTVAQWLLNVALNANPIGLIIIAIAALVALIVVIIRKYDEWGAALTLMMGPFGMIINLIMSFKKNWDMVKKAFSTGGIIEGLKAIGATILDALLVPIQSFLELLSNIPGVGDLAAAGAKEIEALRKSLGIEVNTGDKEVNNNTELVNPEASKQEALTRTIREERSTNATLTINDPSNRSSIEAEDGFIPVIMQPTQ